MYRAITDEQDRIKAYYDCVVIGGGPAGIMAALSARKCGDSVIIIEKNQMLGRKLRITGKGRCNITNICDFDTLMENIPGNSRFLYSAFSNFSNYDIIDFFNNIGLKTVVERGGRVFPESQKAGDVAGALVSEAKKQGVVIRYGCEVKEIYFEGEGSDFKVKGVRFAENDMEVFTEKVIIATGGISYPLTGSTGDGYKWATQAGHTIVTPKASLVALVCKGKWIKELEGLSLKNVSFSLASGGKTLYKEQGEMVFTSNGVSGPVILSASRHAMKYDYKNLVGSIDFKPALSEEKLSDRILRDFQKFNRKIFANSLDDLLPRKLIPVIVKLSGISGTKPVCEITKEERMALVKLLKDFTMNVVGSGPLSEAIVTAGGVKTSEINPKTMESKLCKGLFFAGEVIDVDGYTGGYNLTIAFSTGYAAGNHN